MSQSEIHMYLDIKKTKPHYLVSHMMIMKKEYPDITFRVLKNFQMTTLVDLVILFARSEASKKEYSLLFAHDGSDFEKDIQEKYSHFSEKIKGPDCIVDIDRTQLDEILYLLYSMSNDDTENTFTFEKQADEKSLTDYFVCKSDSEGGDLKRVIIASHNPVDFKKNEDKFVFFI